MKKPRHKSRIEQGISTLRAYLTTKPKISIVNNKDQIINLNTEFLVESELKGIEAKKKDLWAVARKHVSKLKMIKKIKKLERQHIYISHTINFEDDKSLLFI